MVRAMEDVKRKLEHMTSLFGSKQGGSGMVTNLMKRVKGSDFWDKDHIKRNTRDNVQMSKSSDAMEAEYVKPLRKINSSKSICFDEAASSCSETGSSCTCKSVKFGQFVEEICYVGSTPEPTKEEEEKRCMILEVLGLDATPSSPAGSSVDQVVQAVAAARLSCMAAQPSISLIPLNDQGTPLCGAKESQEQEDQGQEQVQQEAEAAAAPCESPSPETEELRVNPSALTVELPVFVHPCDSIMPEHSASGPVTPVDLQHRKPSHPDQLDFGAVLTLKDKAATDDPGSGILSSCSTIAASSPPPISLPSTAAKTAKVQDRDSVGFSAST
mmetsp:Transcript_33184/g.51675  ORF Transcript_33184/g.51675 Transcript_33184/m.51675 type:complete len:328 (+) Transcript_33184:520-1503(+)|eukprot:CAMPEP_0184306394 /NCGR_PEP_ID=MMETSP1049-20130417/15396_1 /TAXON_ID=77928 /ORGANISM="Proteomonas sulcata, Strain CCMP704" /LENGTH=327 /DNA_ID=CAMNT_0026618637 /DNA_START=408 /DNA_END=1391 /DNA_ORIENTATION=-